MGYDSGIKTNNPGITNLDNPALDGEKNKYKDKKYLDAETSGGITYTKFKHVKNVKTDSSQNSATNAINMTTTKGETTTKSHINFSNKPVTKTTVNIDDDSLPDGWQVESNKKMKTKNGKYKIKNKMVATREVANTERQEKLDKKQNKKITNANEKNQKLALKMKKLEQKQLEAQKKFETKISSTTTKEMVQIGKSGIAPTLDENGEQVVDAQGNKQFHSTTKYEERTHVDENKKTRLEKRANRKKTRIQKRIDKQKNKKVDTDKIEQEYDVKRSKATKTEKVKFKYKEKGIIPQKQETPTPSPPPIKQFKPLIIEEVDIEIEDDLELDNKVTGENVFGTGKYKADKNVILGANGEATDFNINFQKSGQKSNGKDMAFMEEASTFVTSMAGDEKSTAFLHKGSAKKIFEQFDLNKDGKVTTNEAQLYTKAIKKNGEENTNQYGADKARMIDNADIERMGTFVNKAGGKNGMDLNELKGALEEIQHGQDGSGEYTRDQDGTQVTHDNLDMFTTRNFNKYVEE